MISNKLFLPENLKQQNLMSQGSLKKKTQPITKEENKLSINLLLLTYQTYNQAFLKVKIILLH